MRPHRVKRVTQLSAQGWCRIFSQDLSHVVCAAATCTWIMHEGVALNPTNSQSRVERASPTHGGLLRLNLNCCTKRQLRPATGVKP